MEDDIKILQLLNVSNSSEVYFLVKNKNILPDKLWYDEGNSHVKAFRVNGYVISKTNIFKTEEILLSDLTSKNSFRNALIFNKEEGKKEIRKIIKNYIECFPPFLEEIPESLLDYLMELDIMI